jgi:hypothetical protein
LPTIAIVNGVYLMIYPNDHLPPHVHAKFAEHRCKISIVTGRLIDGKLPPSKLQAVQTWLDDHRSEVSFAWDEIRSGRSIDGMIK